MKKIAIMLLAAMSISVLLLSGCTGISPAVSAVFHDDVDSLRDLLDAGLSPNYVEIFNGSNYPGSLLEHSMLGGHVTSTELLLQRGADMRLSAAEIFKKAQYHPNPDAVALNFTKTFLAKGLSPNEKLPDGQTLLHLTCSYPESTGLLLANGALVDAYWKSPRSTTPLGNCLLEAIEQQANVKQLHELYENDDAATYRLFVSRHIKKYEQALKNILVLLKAGADPNAEAFTGLGTKTVLLNRAYQGKNMLVVEAMLDHGADVLTLQEPWKMTSLHYLVPNFQDPKAARDLIARARKAAARKAIEAHNPDEADAIFSSWLNQPYCKPSTDPDPNDGLTALHFAATKGATGVISELIDAGADYSLKSKSGQTAQDFLDIKNAKDREDAVANQEAIRRRNEKAERDAHTAEVNRQGLLAIVGAVGIAKATSGKNISDAQRSGLIDAWATDRANAANGVESDNFGQAAGSVKRQLDIASMAAASQSRQVAEAQRVGGNSSPQVVQATRGERAQSAVSAANGEDFDALGSQSTLCANEVRRYAEIQMFPGAQMNELNISRLKCAISKSRGVPQAAYRDRLFGVQGLIRQYASEECNPEIGCRGKTRLGNI